MNGEDTHLCSVVMTKTVSKNVCNLKDSETEPFNLIGAYPGLGHGD